jgi:hypothetical protein
MCKNKERVEMDLEDRVTVFFKVLGEEQDTITVLI